MLTGKTDVGKRKERVKTDLGWIGCYGIGETHVTSQYKFDRN